MNKFAGIGSRETPVWALKLCRFIAIKLAEDGWLLRSGGAPGADKAFEGGCSSVKGKKEIYLPWSGFEGNPSPLHTITEEAKAMALKFHPAPHVLEARQGLWKLMARNCYQVLGQRLNDPVKMVVCYTKLGAGQGGTGQALRIAKFHQIPIFDLGDLDEEPKEKRVEAVAEFLTNLPT